MPRSSTALPLSPPLPRTSTLEDLKWDVSDLALELPDSQPGRPVVRMLPYPWPLVLGGITTICPGCGARRDWLLKGAELQWLQHPALDAHVDEVLFREGVSAFAGNVGRGLSCAA